MAENAQNGAVRAVETYEVRDSVSVPMIGAAEPRYEARAKVTGEARYAADEPSPGALYAALVTTPVARGRVRRIDTRAAEALDGVRLVMTHENTNRHPDVTPYMQGGWGQSAFQPLADSEIRYAGQIVAMVVAETLEGAREAAEAVVVDARAERNVVGSMHADDAPPATEMEQYEKLDVGDVGAVFAAADTTVDATYTTPTQHHNPIELYSTTAEWRGGTLLAFVPSQWVVGTRTFLSEAFDTPSERIQVVSRYVGGGFGSKATVMEHTFLTAEAARRLDQPVKLYATRHEMFSIGSHRPETRHRIRIAVKDGRMTGFRHDQAGQTSRYEDVSMTGSEVTARMYGFDAIRTRESIVRGDVNTPGFMRAPGEMPTLYALESAVDEAAWAAGIDPVALRLASDSDREPVDGLPWTSRSYAECLRRGAESFGWDQHGNQVGSLRNGDWEHGFGVAMASYPAYTGTATAQVKLTSDLSCRVSAAAHDLGGGTYTVLQQLVAAELGIPMNSIRVELGDSDLPANGVAGGSMQTASVGSAVLDACRRIRSRLAERATAAGGVLEGASADSVRLEDGRVVSGRRRASLSDVFETVEFGVIVERGTFVPGNVSINRLRELYRRGNGGRGGFTNETHARASFGAQFAEVAVNRRTGEIRVPRLHGAFAAGRIMNERTARNQLTGGMIWGLGSAVHEATEMDPRFARWVNTDLAEYAVPVNADVPEVRAIFVEEEDRHINPLGVKGIGELGITGVAAAIANGVYHATGVRVRDLPIRIEKIMEGARA